MLKDVVLAIFPFWDVQRPPLGLAYLAGALKRHGMGFQVRDYNIDFFRRYYLPARQEGTWSSPLGRRQFWQALAGLATGVAVAPPQWSETEYSLIVNAVTQYACELSALRPSVLAVSTFANTMALSLAVIRKFKCLCPETLVCLGGPQASWHSAYLLERFPEVDAIFAGEADMAFARALVSMGRGRKPHLEARLYPPSPRPFPDVLPRPDFSGFPLSRYTTIALPVLGSRGCPGRCAFCADPK